MRSLHHPSQADLFRNAVFETRARIESFDVDRFRLRTKQAMSQALSACGRDREEVAADMARMLGQPSLSKGMLDAYTSPAKLGHDIPLLRFKALARATQMASLWDSVISDEGLFLLKGDEPRLAEIARLQQAQREISAQIKQLTAVPVEIKRG